MAKPDAANRHGDDAEGHFAVVVGSLSSALEHLAAGTQGVFAKRIDLALLEVQRCLLA